jgi:hypothetical protein
MRKQAKGKLIIYLTKSKSNKIKSIIGIAKSKSNKIKNLIKSKVRRYCTNKNNPYYQYLVFMKIWEFRTSTIYNHSGSPSPGNDTSKSKAS